jgi:uncharacterized membrane protein
MMPLEDKVKDAEVEESSINAGSYRAKTQIWHSGKLCEPEDRFRIANQEDFAFRSHHQYRFQKNNLVFLQAYGR